jgi:hypothetical protein
MSLALFLSPRPSIFFFPWSTLDHLSPFLQLTSSSHLFFSISAPASFCQGTTNIAQLYAIWRFISLKATPTIKSMHLRLFCNWILERDYRDLHTVDRYSIS